MYLPIKNIKSVKPEKKIYTFKYEGELEYIDIGTFITSQLHFTNIINEVKSELYPEQKLDIKVKPLPKGSWQIELMMLLSSVETEIFTPGNVIGALTLIITAVVGIIQIKQALKGKKPQKIIEQDEKITIQSAENVEINTTKQIYNIYANNLSVNYSLKKTFEVIDNDEEIDGIRLINEREEELMRIDRPQFRDISADNEIFEEQSQETVIKEAGLRIFKVVFGEGYKWQFYYMGNKISVDVKDHNFINRVESGDEDFSSGDQIIADLIIKQLYDKRVDTFINKSYTIERVLQHIKRPEQGKMDFKE
jgi:hypothetical protein